MNGGREKVQVDVASIHADLEFKVEVTDHLLQFPLGRRPLQDPLVDGGSCH